MKEEGVKERERSGGRDRRERGVVHDRIIHPRSTKSEGLQSRTHTRSSRRQKNNKSKNTISFTFIHMYTNKQEEKQTKREERKEKRKISGKTAKDSDFAQFWMWKIVFPWKVLELLLCLLGFFFELFDCFWFDFIDFCRCFWLIFDFFCFYFGFRSLE